MVLKNTFVKCVDNTGAKVLKVLQVVGYSSSSVPGYAGDELLVVVRHAVPNKKAKVGHKYRALLIQSSATVRRPFGDVVRGRNLAVLLRPGEDLPLGNRISKRYAVFKEVKAKGWTKVAQLASKLILPVCMSLLFSPYVPKVSVYFFEDDLVARGYSLWSFPCFSTRLSSTVSNSDSSGLELLKLLFFFRNTLDVKPSLSNYKKFSFVQSKISHSLSPALFFLTLTHIFRLISLKELDYKFLFNTPKDESLEFILSFRDLEQLSVDSQFDYFGWKSSIFFSLLFKSSASPDFKPLLFFSFFNFTLRHEIFGSKR